MDGNGYLIIIIVLAVTNLVTAGILLRRKADRVLLPNFDEYVRKHGCASEQGSTRCWKCGSTSIHVDWKGYGRGVNVHSCRHCGTRLYRS